MHETKEGAHITSVKIVLNAVKLVMSNVPLDEMLTCLFLQNYFALLPCYLVENVDCYSSLKIRIKLVCRVSERKHKMQDKQSPLSESSFALLFKSSSAV